MDSELQLAAKAETRARYLNDKASRKNASVLLGPCLCLGFICLSRSHCMLAASTEEVRGVEGQAGYALLP